MLAISICVFTVVKTELILRVLRTYSGLKLISTVYLFNNASNELILDSIFKYKTILLGLFRTNQFVEHGEKIQLMGLFTLQMPHYKGIVITVINAAL